MNANRSVAGIEGTGENACIESSSVPSVVFGGVPARLVSGVSPM